MCLAPRFLHSLLKRTPKTTASSGFPNQTKLREVSENYLSETFKTKPTASPPVCRSAARPLWVLKDESDLLPKWLEMQSGSAFWPKSNQHIDLLSDVELWQEHSCKYDPWLNRTHGIRCSKLPWCSQSVSQSVGQQAAGLDADCSRDQTLLLLILLGVQRRCANIVYSVSMAAKLQRLGTWP